MDIVLITGSAELIGSESVEFFCEQGFKPLGQRRACVDCGPSTEPGVGIQPSLLSVAGDGLVDLRDYSSGGIIRSR
jgi:hypothetical protein